jgi:signal transduction histidine kinase
MALYARRVLRAARKGDRDAHRAVARATLEARTAVQTDDEIGELAVTFERMVAAIAAGERTARRGGAARHGRQDGRHVPTESGNPLSSIALNLELLEEQIGVLRQTARPATERGTRMPKRTHLRAIDARGRGGSPGSASGTWRSPGSRPRSISSRRTWEPSRARALAEFVRRELEQHGIELELDVAGELPTVLADEGQLRQALLNLVRNAREAMPKGGRIAVRVRDADDGGVLLIVEDEGPGIDPAHRQHLFEPFFTTKSHGTGLGLAITQQIAKAHGGSIDCEPLPGERGTRFTLRLPGAPPASPPARSSPENAAE